MTEIISPRMPRPVRAARTEEVSVNGVLISRAEIAREIQNHEARTPAEAWHAAARALVVRELLLAEAARLGIAAEPARHGDGSRETDEEATIRALLAQEVKVPTADTATCRRHFERNRASFRSGDLYEVAHILLPAAPDDMAGRAAARAQAEAILADILAGRAAFADMARAHSACPSREVGGSLGQIGRGQTVAEFEAALAQMVPGAVHPAPVESRYGFHLVVLAHRIEGRDLPFEMAEAAIAGHLELTAWHVATRQYLSLLIGRADIRGVTLEGAASPLVQ
ncbi:peptidylprolyl isomerase [Aquabacter sp. L1I39]|uniref:peptidylprolyl isomerase n=1 Tax=Aquabacter sp. L1I39 TaxID=2820278 RepID=UPI001AD95230|nr:peptidylprolyl isomerase [Aquabacter sp. L1I39]QTL04399.1 peptidylprolyl isomerase [Aquabacter sp. L1I39]